MAGMNLSDGGSSAGSADDILRSGVQYESNIGFRGSAVSTKSGSRSKLYVFLDFLETKEIYEVTLRLSAINRS